MTDDPLADLRNNLVSAARDRARPHHRRRTMLLSAATTAILVPAAAAATGVIGGATQGVFSDRSSFIISTVPDPRGAGTCDRVEYRDATGGLDGRTLTCPASNGGPAPDGELPTGLSAQSGPVVVLLGRTPAGTARVDVPAAIGEVVFDPAAFRFAAKIPRDKPMLAIAHDADGHELARFTAPAMQPSP